jgi:hypothetical protein
VALALFSGLTVALVYTVTRRSAEEQMRMRNPKPRGVDARARRSFVEYRIPSTGGEPVVLEPMDHMDEPPSPHGGSSTDKKKKGFPRLKLKKIASTILRKRHKGRPGCSSDLSHSVHVLADGHHTVNGTRTFSAESCPICLDDMGVLGGSSLLLLNCGHVFHKSCVNP